MTSPGDRLVADYLKRLNRELRDVPRARRKEFVADISGHVAEGRALLPHETEDEIWTLLVRLGDPADIAAEVEGSAAETRRSRWQEPAAIVLLLLGGFIFVIGWIAGVVLLWASPRWTALDKLIGTLVIPLGLGAAAFLVLIPVDSTETFCGPLHQQGGWSCTTHTSGGGAGTFGLPLFFAVLIAPLATTVYLSLRLKRRSARHARSAGFLVANTNREE